MSLWQKVQQLPRDLLTQLHALYDKRFPIEVRHCLAPYIEEQVQWDAIDPDNTQNEVFAAGILTSMIEQIEKICAANIQNEPIPGLMNLKLNEAINILRNLYSSHPLLLVRTVLSILESEKKLVEFNADGPSPSTGMGSDTSNFIDIAQQINILRKKTQESEHILSTMQQDQEKFVIQYQESSKLGAHLQQIENHGTAQANPEDVKKIQRQKGLIDNILSNQAQAILKRRVDLIQFYKETCSLITSLQSHVVDDILIRWKHEQQQSGNSGVFNNNLDQIQEWCGDLADINWKNRQQIKQIQILQEQLPINTPGTADELPLLNNKITALLSNLVTSTFVIEKQPPQVMKTNTRFGGNVRLLVGHKLSVYLSPPQVRVSIISEAQANNILKNESSNKEEVSGEILNNTGTMEYHQATKQLSCSFRNMQLRKIKRAEKKGTESVMDEKFALLFQTQFKVGGGELVFRVWTLSLPVVVIVHGNQEPHAWATVSWDNAFAEPGRVPFAVPEKVAWMQVARALNCKFRAVCGGELSEDNLRYLAGKAFRNHQIQDYTNMMLSWQLFCKEPLPERNFTFWEWFYAIMKVTREHLRNLWNDGKIIGFVSRRRAEEMCLSSPSGTFLLRYSDSELGGVTIAWVADEQVFMLQPFTIRDFTIRTLADRISDLKHLTQLYPGIPKDQAFSKYYTPFTDNQSTASNGYVRPLLVTQIPGLPSSGCGVDSYPNTPQMLHGPQSPESVYLTSDNQSVCSPLNEPMAHSGAAAPDMECDLLNMDLISDDIPVDFSSINVSDLIVYSKPN